MNEALQIPEQQAQVIQFNNSRDKEVKYRKDGGRKMTVCNKLEGVSSEVYAFKNKEEIKTVIEVLNKKIDEAKTEFNRKAAERNKLLFLIGVNVGLRASDLRVIKWNFFLESIDKENNSAVFNTFYKLQPKKQRKQGKFVTIYFNDVVKKAVINYLKKYPVDNLDDYVFFSRNGEGEAISYNMMSKVIKNTAIEAGIKQNINTHSLRKTWAYWAWHDAEDKNKTLVIMQAIFNHSDIRTTMKYIGLLNDEIEDVYNSVNIGCEGLE